MFYKFNSFTGRIGQATQQQAYLPQGFQPEVPLPNIPKKPAEPVRKMASVSISTPKEGAGPNLGRVPLRPEYQNLMKLQKFFQKTDHENVCVTTGRAKFISYGGVALTAAAFCLTMYSLIGHVFKGKE